MSEKIHESKRDELASYLLGALDPGEAATLEQHLAGCEECRAELDWLRPAALMLPETVERVEPPAELRARIMDEVETDAGAKRSRARAGWTVRSPLLRPAVGLAVLALFVAAIAGYAIRDSGPGGGAATTTVVAGKAPGVTAKLVRGESAGTLRLANVHELPPGKVLQAWVRRGKRIESAQTLFVPNRDGTATAVIDDMHDVNAVMVTTEPAGGSDYPTSGPIVAVSIPQ
jgi:anti-sigma-K factor RskA